MNWLNGLTQDQLDAVEEFKRRNIKDATPRMLEDETVFYRFMKARDFNIENAETMFKKHLSWRKQYQVETLLTEYKTPEFIEKYYPNSFVCFDKDGCIVRYLHAGSIDPRGLLNSCTRQDWMKSNILLAEKDFELTKKQSIKLGKPITMAVYIVDYDQLTFSNATYRPAIEMTMVCINTLQDNYPERIKAIYVINASVYTTIMFSIIKTVIAAAVLQKIKIFNRDNWKDVLLQNIHADDLPAFLGGNKTDRDGNPLCKSFILIGQPVPSHYALSESKKRLSLNPRVKKLKISPFSKQDIKFEVDDPGSILEWEFETKSKDIGFGLYYEENSYQAAIQLLPKQRVETSFDTEAGIYKCEKSGTYIITFDNSYSWIYTKEIHYMVRIIEPNVIENDSK